MATPYERVKAAWDSADRRAELNHVVEMMAIEGSTRDALDAALDQLLMEVRAAGADDDTEEIIMSVGDRLHGWCHVSRHIITQAATLPAVEEIAKLPRRVKVAFEAKSVILLAMEKIKNLCSLWTMDLYKVKNLNSLWKVAICLAIGVYLYAFFDMMLLRQLVEVESIVLFCSFQFLALLFSFAVGESGMLMLTDRLYAAGRELRELFQRDVERDVAMIFSHWILLMSAAWFACHDVNKYLATLGILATINVLWLRSKVSQFKRAIHSERLAASSLSSMETRLLMRSCQDAMQNWIWTYVFFACTILIIAICMRFDNSQTWTLAVVLMSVKTVLDIGLTWRYLAKILAGVGRFRKLFAGEAKTSTPGQNRPEE